MTDHDDCGVADDAHEVLLRFEYDLTVDPETDRVKAHSATVHNHIHGVPLEVAVQTMAMTAVKLLGDHMAHTTFEGCPSPELAHSLGATAAKAFLVEYIQGLPDLEVVDFSDIPDDISSLLEEG